jgi:putative ABC transport system substrate-binding protein
VGLLVNPNNPTLAGPIANDLQGATRGLGLDLHILHASAENDFEGVFTRLNQLRTGALVIGPDPLFGSRLARLAALTLRHRVPAIYLDRIFAAAGGLMTYGASLTDAWRLAGTYAARIISGDKPADLPVQQATRVELVFNLRTAKMLGLKVSESFLLRADEVIE